MLTPPTLVNNILFYPKSGCDVISPFQGILLQEGKSEYPGNEAVMHHPKIVVTQLTIA